MSEKTKFPIEQAQRVAMELRQMLLPHCEQVEIAGSIRRRKPMVGDIELLYIPKVTQQQDGLFAENQIQVDLAENYIRWLLKEKIIDKRPSRTGSFTWGPSNKLGLHVASGIPLDLFATTPANWWVSLVIRTGSKETNLRLTNGAIRRHLTLNAYGAGATDGNNQVTRARSEAHVFELCGIAYLAPEKR